MLSPLKSIFKCSMIIKINLFEDFTLMQGGQIHICAHVHMEILTCVSTHTHTKHTSAKPTTFYGRWHTRCRRAIIILVGPSDRLLWSCCCHSTVIM